jgi:hypothetical protein
MLSGRDRPDLALFFQIMDLHIYTLKQQEKHLLPELKEIAQGLGIIPDGNKTRRETWVAALVGQPFPLFQSLENSPGVDLAQESSESLENSPGDIEEAIEMPAENSPGVDRVQVPEEVFHLGDLWQLERADCPACGAIDSLNAKWSQEYAHGFWIIYCQKCDSNTSCSVEELPPCLRDDEDDEDDENSPGVDRAQESTEFCDLKSALAEIARLRTQNEELIKLVRSQSEKIQSAKDISPVEKPSLKRVLALARSACLDVFKNAEGSWILSMGPLKRSFRKLRQIWDLLIVDDWYLDELFSPPPPPPPPLAAKPLFAPIYSRYSAIPFCDDDLIDLWSLGVNVAANGRSPPAGGDAI